MKQVQFVETKLYSKLVSQKQVAKIKNQLAKKPMVKSE